MTTQLKEYTLKDVADKNNENGCWVVMDNKVYDLTKFLEEHPGGGEVILEQGGGDATEAFNDVGHSSDAREMAKEYLIGTIALDDSSPSIPAKKEDGSGQDWKAILTSPTWTNFLIPAVVSVLVYGFYKGVKCTLG
uniref:Cytochrome b5 heme-binding domain-containing protein n=1 Tax=Rhabditophanes sp. KR3021 TaxID=114890 RepID=A0AC35U316_9BILA